MKFNKKDIESIKIAFQDKYDLLTKDDIYKVFNYVYPGKNTNELADLFGVHPATIRKWKNGDREPNGINKLVFRAILAKHDLLRKNN
ncbi:MAG: hypothetical protein JXA53_10050 [Bacteroidales bacterium]|nr:hypothetical protein [Bacteroidales bacterium]